MLSDLKVTMLGYLIKKSHHQGDQASQDTTNLKKKKEIKGRLGKQVSITRQYELTKTLQCSGCINLLINK